MSDIRQLYQRIIIDHSNYPHHYGKLACPDFVRTCRNPDCGDTITVFVSIDTDCFNELSFIGDGCAISQASASIMTDTLIDKTVAEATQLIQEFQKLLLGQHITTGDLGDSVVFGKLKQFPTRVRCGALAWHAVSDVIEEWGKRSGQQINFRK